MEHTQQAQGEAKPSGSTSVMPEAGTSDPQQEGDASAKSSHDSAILQARRASKERANERAFKLICSGEDVSPKEIDAILAVYAEAVQEPPEQRDDVFFIDFTCNAAKALGALDDPAEKTQERYNPFRNAYAQVWKIDTNAADLVLAAISSALPKSLTEFDSCVLEHKAMKERIQARGINIDDVNNDEWSNYAETTMNLSNALMMLPDEDKTIKHFLYVEQAGKYITSQEDIEVFNDNIETIRDVIDSTNEPGMTQLLTLAELNAEQNKAPGNVTEPGNDPAHVASKAKKRVRFVEQSPGAIQESATSPGETRADETNTSPNKRRRTTEVDRLGNLPLVEGKRNRRSAETRSPGRGGR